MRSIPLLAVGLVLAMVALPSANAYCVRWYNYDCKDDPNDPTDCQGTEVGPSTGYPHPIGAYYCINGKCSVVGATSDCSDEFLIESLP